MTTLSRTRWVLAALGFSAALTLCFPAAAQLDAFHAQFWSQASFGFSAPEDYDNFGRALAAGDFDGDGFADLAIGTPREDVLVAIGYNIVDAGTVTVLYGTADGLSTTDAQLFRQGGGGLDGTAEEGDFWGNALAVGDFDGDGYDDLGVGAPLHDNGTYADMGEVEVIYGSAAGLTAEWSGAITDFYFGLGADLYIGWALTAGDFDGDGYDDLAAGMPGGVDEGGSGSCVTGAVIVFYGSPLGIFPLSGAEDYWNPLDDLGQPFRCVQKFGEAIAAGDVDRDGYDDLLVGAPNTAAEIPHLQLEAGAAHLIHGSETGLTATGSRTLFGLVESDHLGAAVAIGNVVRTTPTNPREVVIGTPGREVTTVDNAGSVLVCQVGDAGFSDHTWWDQATAGVDDFVETDDYFGSVLAVGNFDGDAQEDLAIGIPLEDHLETNAGMVQVLRGEVDGLTTIGQQIWHQQVAGVPDVQESGEQLGRALAVGDFNDDGRPDLAIGIPYEPLGGYSQGAVIVLYAQRPGLIFADDFESSTTTRWN